MIEVRLQRLAHGVGLPLPARMTEHAAGFDLSAAVDEPITIPPGDIARIPCGFALAIPIDHEAQIRPRSGLASKLGVTLPNSPGTIDADYRGEIIVPLINLGREPFVVTRGTRIAQMLIAPVPRVNLVEVEELDQTLRGSSGFGHTGESV